MKINSFVFVLSPRLKMNKFDFAPTVACLKTKCSYLVMKNSILYGFDEIEEIPEYQVMDCVPFAAYKKLEMRSPNIRSEIWISDEDKVLLPN